MKRDKMRTILRRDIPDVIEMNEVKRHSFQDILELKKGKKDGLMTVTEKKIRFNNKIYRHLESQTAIKDITKFFRVKNND